MSAAQGRLPTHPHLSLVLPSSFLLLQSGQAQLDFILSAPVQGQGGPAGGEAKPRCLSAFELLWELLEALVSGSWRGRRRVLKEISEGQVLEEGKGFFPFAS